MVINSLYMRLFVDIKEHSFMKNGDDEVKKKCKRAWEADIGSTQVYSEHRIRSF